MRKIWPSEANCSSICENFAFYKSQTTSEDVCPEDERLNFRFLGVKEARITLNDQYMVSSNFCMPYWIRDQEGRLVRIENPQDTDLDICVNIMDPPPEDQNSQQGQGGNPNAYLSMRDRMHPPRMSAPSCIIPPLEQLVIRPHIVPLLPTFHGMESENPYAHIKEFEEDKAKIWLNSLRPRSIRSWVDLQADFLKKFFPTHRTNGLKRQISNFYAKENEKFHECWERYMEAINACPHHGFDTWLLVSYFYDGISSSMKQILETMCGGDFMSKNPEEAMDFLSYVSEVSRGWDEPTQERKGSFPPNQPKIQKVECLTTMHLMETPITQAGETILIFLGNQDHLHTNHKPNPSTSTNLFSGAAIVNLSKVMGDFVGEQKAINSQLHQKIENVESSQIKRMEGMQNDLSQKIDNIQYSISRLTNLNTVTEKGKFPSQPSQNPKGVHEVETQEGESSKLREVKAVITLRSGKEIDQPLPKVKQDEELMSRKPWSKRAITRREQWEENFTWKEGNQNSSEILEVLRQVKVNIPLLDMIKQVPTYAKFLKDLCTVKRGLHVTKNAFLTEQVSAIIQSKSPVKYKDPGCPTISVNIGGTHVEKALLDLGASVSKNPKGVIEDVLVQVDKFYYPVDFVVLDTDPTVKEANYVPIILGRPFLATSNAIINCRNGVMQLTFGNMTLELNIFHLCKRHLHPEKRKDWRRCA
ncbi:hypothetical protein CK203_107360 [Vitis vinifera]|uniref:Retrotransposon gag domain-containing protein n=1 Tax=Vitis vinifera TaxID=29760 RepID=A0A438FG57_VITVI|nr:hypothetical protein CK203_107360 [Vitis vinifera]